MNQSETATFARLAMKRRALAYLDSVMTIAPPPSDVARRAKLVAEIAELEHVLMK